MTSLATPRPSTAVDTKVVPVLSALAVMPAVGSIVLLFVSVGLAAASLGAYSGFARLNGNVRR
jgi:hypothetical protein